VQNVEAVYLRLSRRPVPAECCIDGRMDPVVERLRAGFFGFPYLDVLQPAVRLANAKVKELTGQPLWPELVRDASVEIFADRNILDVRIDHHNHLL
jgi:hypothetical protein